MVVAVSAGFYKTADEIQLDEVLCHAGKPLPPAHLSRYTSWARVVNSLSLVRLGIREQVAANCFNDIWARTTIQLVVPLYDEMMKPVRDFCDGEGASDV